jgi:NADPH2:quinone reductase
VRAIRQLVYGEPPQLQDVPEPQAGPGEQVVTVSRAAVNPLDVWVSAGTVAAAGPLPRTAGCEGAGVTEDGRRVAFRVAGLGLTRDGTFAERVAVPEAALATVPDGCSDGAAASIGIAGVTALDTLDLGGVEAGTAVLLLGGSGAVASTAAQLARSRGATVIAQSTSEEHAAHLRELADHVVTTGHGGLEGAVREVAPDGVDVVLDGLSGPFTGPAVRLLKRRGRLVLYGASAGPELTVASAEMYRKQASILGYSGLADDPAEVAGRMEHLMAEVAAGRLQPVIADELPLDQVTEAFRRIREREAGGKLLLVP